MDTLPPAVRHLITKVLVWLCTLLIGAFVAVGWWRLTQLSVELREFDRRLTKVETKVISPTPEKDKQ